MKVKSLIAVIALGFTTFVSADNYPTKCPSVNSLVATDWDVIVKNDERSGYWGAFQNFHRYDTGFAWTFAFGDFPAKDENDAKIQATKELSSAILVDITPEEVLENEWMCFYGDALGHLKGIAMYPAKKLSSYKELAQLLQS